MVRRGVVFERSRSCSALLALAGALGALTASLVPAAVARAHGELEGQIEEVTRQLEAELRKPYDGHERGKYLHERGELYRLHREWKKAEADYELALSHDPDNDQVELSRAAMLLEAGAPARARPGLERFLRNHVDHPQALLLQAQLLVALGEGVGAVRFLDRALRRHPQPEPDHYLARVEVLETLGDRYLPRALRGLDEGMRKLGPLVSLEEKAIALELRRGRPAAALARIDRQAARSARPDQWLARRAEILEQTGRSAEARQARTRALAAIRELPPTLQSRPTTTALRERLFAAQNR